MSDIDVEALRALTPGCANRNHLNNAGAALLSSVTIAAMTDYLQREALIGGYEAEAEAADQIGATYAALAELVGALPSQIALFDNSTHAWNAACYSVPFQAGDRILTGRNEYGSAVLAYLQLAQRTGAEVVCRPGRRRRPDRCRRARRSDRRANQADRTDVGTHRGRPGESGR